MSDTIVVAFDGSDAGHRAVSLAAAHSKSTGAKLIVAHVLDWSPYSFLTQEELAERHKRRSEELARAESAVITPIMARLSADGVDADSEIRYGHVAESLVKIAQEHKATQIFIGRKGHDGFAARLFGSVTSSLAQVAPVPVTIVP